jgi:hypothetical protein
MAQAGGGVGCGLGGQGGLGWVVRGGWPRWPRQEVGWEGGQVGICCLGRWCAMEGWPR